MNISIKSVIDEFDKVTVEVKTLFGNLSSQQLNWKPAPEKWSIAQCLHHLIVSNSSYENQLDEIIAGGHKNSFYQNIRFIARFFGNYLIREIGPVVGKPMKNPLRFAPSQSEIDTGIVNDFAQHQKQFSLRLVKLDKYDLEKTIIYSPAMKLITYSVADALIILSGHERRHFSQTKQVMNHPKFPK